MYLIEHVSRNPEENSVVIKGYAYNRNGEPVDIDIDYNGIISDGIEKTEKRLDVTLDLDSKKNNEVGFKYKLYLDELKGKIELTFKHSGPKGEDEMDVINLNKKRSHKAERDVRAEVIKNELKGFKNFIASGKGIKYLAKKLSNKFSNNRDENYYTWIDRNEKELTKEEVDEILESLKYKPLISILVPVYNVKLEYLKDMVDSVLDQYYPNWELCLADDNPPDSDEETREYLKELAKQNERIKVVFREQNGGISEATNSAFELSTGEYIALLDDDDILAKNALLENVIIINENPDVEVIYSDEDKIDDEGVRSKPHFKPDFAYHKLLAVNYICHFLMFKRSLVENDEKIFDSKYDGAQDHDLVLRLTERTDNIVHIPKVLYHWRISDTSIAKSMKNKVYASDAGIRAVEAALKRRGLSGKVTLEPNVKSYVIDFDIKDYKKVSIIIPTKNNPNDLMTCINSIVSKTVYPNYEIVIVDNNNNKESKELIEEIRLTNPEIIKVLELPIPFNYSRINNIAAERSDGDYYLFLNDDTEVITKGWITKMVGYAQLPETGCVGVKLLYPDNTIQHAGVIIGMAGLAGHVFTRYPRHMPGYFGILQTNGNYSAVTAACLMISKDKFWEVGGFDEDIAVSFNDVDLCLKVLDAGYYNVYLASVEVYHFESKSRGLETTADRAVRFDKECAKLQRKWRKYIYHDPMYSPNLTLFGGDFSINI